MLKEKIKLEQVLFYILLLSCCIPIFSYEHFPSLDGPAHLYNSQLLSELIKGNSFIDDFYYINAKAFPNWIGHGFLTVSKIILPSVIAEKLLLLTYIISLAIIFRKLTLSLNPSSYMSSVVFPFIYCAPFFHGFYSFLLALPILLYFIYYLKFKFDYSNQSFLILGVIQLVLYFSHSFSYMISLLFLGIDVGLVLLTNIKKESFKASFRKNIILVGKSFMFNSISLVLLGVFMYQHRSFNESFLSFDTLLDSIVRIRPIISYHTTQEGEYSMPLFFVLFGFFSFHLISQLNWHISKKQFSELLSRKNTSIFIVSLVLVFLYFKLPDGVGYASFISVRSLLLLFLFFLLWAITISKTKWLEVFVIVCTTYVHISLLFYYTDSLTKQNEVIADIKEVGELIENNKVVYPIAQIDMFEQGHFSNYLGIDKPLVILDNYEANIDYFPVNWYWEAFPYIDREGNCYTKESPNSWPKRPMNKRYEIDYVLVYGAKKDEYKLEACFKNLIADYVVLKENRFAMLLGKR